MRLLHLAAYGSYRAGLGAHGAAFALVRFYLENGIDFFLFGPNLTLLVQGAEVCYCIFNVPVVYENGAKVATGFVTNLRKDLRIWVDHELREWV